MQKEVNKEIKTEAKNVVIIGTGPAGISAALYTTRAGIKTTVIGKGTGALEKADKIENYYGFADPISGKELISNGILQADRLGVEIIFDEVVGIGYADKFSVKTTKKEYLADSVILAMGASRQAVKIKGFEKFEGHGISYCAVCDGFFYRGKDVAVLGCCEYARAEIMELLSIAKSVTLISNGHPTSANFPPNVKIISTPIKEFSGGAALEKVIFDDNTEIAVSGVFVAIGVAGSADMAKKLGIATTGNVITVDAKMATNIPGFFAAGDCTGGMLQIAKAVYQGAVAGTEVIKFLRNK